MDLGVFYQPVYLIVVSILSLVTMNRYRSVKYFPHCNERLGNNGLALMLTIFLVLVIGNRPTKSLVFGDTVNYTSWYLMYDMGNSFAWDWNSENFIFDNIYSLFASNHIPIKFFFLFISLIYFGGIFIACKKMFPNDTTLALLVYLAAFSTFSYSTNGIKAGAAAAIFLLALAYRNNKLQLLLCSFLSLGFHHSMFVVVVALVCAMFYKKTKTYFYIWAVCVAIAAAHISYFQILFAGYSDEKGSTYLLATGEKESDFITGFRIDFLLYSAIPIAVGYWIIFKKKIVNENYEMWLRLYLLTNSVWILCIYASYSNRIAYLSWFMYPIVLIYPFVGFYWNNKQLTYTKRMVSYHLLFTLFMEVIYYGVIR